MTRRIILAKAMDPSNAILIGLLLILSLLVASCGGDSGSAAQSVSKKKKGGVAPATFAIDSPTANPAYTSSLLDTTLSGICVTGDTIDIAGDVAPSSLTCASSTFSFTLPGGVDGTYQYFVSSTAPGGNVELIPFTLVRDSVPPGAVTITSPISSPVVSSDSILLIWGTCENDATVIVEEVDAGGNPVTSQSTICTSTVYSISINRPGVANYRFNLTQQDQALNTSLTIVQDWVQDASVPSTPVITSPLGNPFFSNTGPVTLTGTCTSTPAHTVTLNDGGFPPPTTACTASAFSFSVATPGGDGTYIHQVTQADDIALIDSAAVVFQWEFDAAPPPVPAILSPASPFTAPDPLAIAGVCEDGAVVDLLTNPGGVVLQTTNCSGGSFTFTVSEAGDGAYAYDIAQSDKAGNPSPGAATLVWNRDSGAVPPPTITSQAVNPFLSNSDTLNLFGGCLTGYTVTLSGDAAGTTPCVAGVYTFTIDKSGDGTDAVYTLNVAQDDGLGGPLSDTVSQVWNRDITAPVVTLLVSPPNPNPSRESRFEFSASEPGSTFECDLNGAGFTGCTSPASYFDLPSGPLQTLQIRARDLAGNVSAPQTVNWVQNAYFTVVLYHLDDGSPLVDSSLYTSGFSNPLGADLVSAAGPAGFAEGRLFNGTSDFMSAPNNAKHASLQSVMTLEAFVKFNALPAPGSKMAFFSKTDLATDQGWEFGIKPQGGSGKFTLYFDGSLDGALVSPTKSARLNTVNLGQFYHVALVWNRGNVTFYFDGAQVGVKAIGTVGVSSLWNSSQPLRLGSSNGAGNFLDGVMDEARISQTLRYTANFSPPASPFSGD